MRLAIRAAVAVALLVGVYVLAFAVLGGTVLLGVLVVRHATGPALKFLVLALLACAAVLRGLWAGVRAGRDDGDTGLLISREAQPELWATVDRLAAAVGTKCPDEIRLIPAVNAAVSEHSSLLGLRPGKRIMYIGVPLIEAFSAAELQAVLAHELGHYSGGHTALGPLVHRGHTAIVQLLVHLRARPFVQRLFIGYAKLFFRVSNAVSRRQEFEADASAAAIAGAGPAASALSRLPSVTAAWKFYLETYVAPPVRANVVPSGLAQGFRALITEPKRREELAAIGVKQEEVGPYDTHPPLHERIAALHRLAGASAETDDSPPASTLLRDFASVEAAMPTLLLNNPLPPVSWEEAANRVAGTAAAAVAQALLEVAAQCDGAATPAGVLDVMAAGRSAELAALVAPQASGDRPQALVWALQCLVRSRLAAEGRAAWTVSWVGAPWQPTGVDLSSVDQQIAAAVEDPSKVTTLRRTLRRLGVLEPD